MGAMLYLERAIHSLASYGGRVWVISDLAKTPDRIKAASGRRWMPPITVDWFWEEVEPISAIEDRDYAATAQWMSYANFALQHCVRVKHKNRDTVHQFEACMETDLYDGNGYRHSY